MAETITGSVSSISKFLQQYSQPFNITFSGNPTRDYERSFTSTDITKLYFNTYTVGTSPTTIDVTSLTDAYGQAISFNNVKHLHIVNNDAANSLTAGGGTNPLFPALPTLVGQSGTPSNGSDVLLTTILTVSSTSKIIQLQAGAGTISVDVLIAGN